MIALDTNLLVYAHRVDSPHHSAAAAALRQAVTGRAGCAIPWPCVHEFLAVVTHQRIYRPPTPGDQAIRAAQALLDMPDVHLLAEGPDHFATLRDLVSTSGITGPKIHDSRIAAICLAHGVDELWSVDRDFSWFPQLRVVNPLANRRF